MGAILPSPETGSLHPLSISTARPFSGSACFRREQFARVCTHRHPPYAPARLSEGPGRAARFAADSGGLRRVAHAMGNRRRRWCGAFRAEESVFSVAEWSGSASGRSGRASVLGDARECHTNVGRTSEPLLGKETVAVSQPYTGAEYLRSTLVEVLVAAVTNRRRIASRRRGPAGPSTVGL